MRRSRGIRSGLRGEDGDKICLNLIRSLITMDQVNLYLAIKYLRAGVRV